MIPRTAAAAAALALFAVGHAAMAASPTPAPMASPARVASPPPMASPAPVASPAASATPMALTLVQAEDIALAQSPQLALARGQLEGAQAGIGISQAGGLPNITGAAATSRSKSVSPGGSFAPGLPASPPTTSLNTAKSASLTLRQLIIDGGRVHAAVQSSRFSTDAARLNLQRQIQNVEFNVAQSYYAALQARHQLQVARDSLNLAQVQGRLVNAQFKAGVASKADVLTAQLPVAQAQLAVAQAINGEQTQLALMLDTMGLPAQTVVSIADETAVPAVLPTLAEVLAVANGQRPDLLAAQASSDAAGASLRSARLGYFPTISGSGTTSTGSNKSTQDSTNAGVPISTTNTGTFTPGWSAGLTLSVPIFDGGLTRAETAAAQAQVDQAAANLRTTQLLVSLNIQQDYLAVETAEAGLTAANAEYAQARTVLDVTNAQYKSGVTTLPLLLNAQVGLAKAESDQVNALYTSKTSWQQLLLAEGTIGH
jgi:outer membrane protein